MKIYKIKPEGCETILIFEISDTGNGLEVAIYKQGEDEELATVKIDAYGGHLKAMTWDSTDNEREVALAEIGSERAVERIPVIDDGCPDVWPVEGLWPGVVAVTADADIYCLDCARKRYGKKAIDAVVNGPGHAFDGEGNEIQAILDHSEDANDLYCAGYRPM